MSVEEEDSGREQSDVEVVDVNLNLIRINVHQSYRSEFRYIPRRFLELKNSKLWETKKIMSAERKGSIQCHREEDSFRRRYGRIVGRALYRSCCWWSDRSLPSLLALGAEQIPSSLCDPEFVSSICINPKQNGNDSNLFFWWFHSV